MADEAVELCVAGQRCRVVTTADPEELKELAAMVEEKLEAILSPGRPVTTQAMLLAAVALANDVREERDRTTAVADKAKGHLQTMLARVDETLAESETRTAAPTVEKGRTRKGRSKKGRGLKKQES